MENKKNFKDEFEEQLMIARQLNLFGDNPTDQERKQAEERLKVIAKLYKEKKR